MASWRENVEHFLFPLIRFGTLHLIEGPSSIKRVLLYLNVLDKLLCKSLDLGSH